MTLPYRDRRKKVEQCLKSTNIITIMTIIMTMHITMPMELPIPMDMFTKIRRRLSTVCPGPSVIWKR